MLKNKWVLGIIIALFASFAFAQAPTPAQVKKVEKLLEVSEFDRMIEEQKKLMVDAITKQTQLKNHANEFSELFSEILDVKSIKKDMVVLYSETFTEQEIDEMIKFNQSPLGQKVHKKLPEMNKKMMAKMQTNIQQNQKKIQDLFMSIALEVNSNQPK